MAETQLDVAGLVRRWYDDIQSRRDVTAVEEIVHPDFVQHHPGGGTTYGSESIKQFLAWSGAVFVDPHWDVEDLIVAGDKVVVRARGESQYEGGWHNIPSKGQRIVETCINIFRIEDRKIRESWYEVSDLDVAYQLSAFPSQQTPSESGDEVEQQTGALSCEH